MVVSFDVADVDARTALRLLRRRVPLDGSIRGLRNANVGFAAPLGQGIKTKPDLWRVAFIGWWTDDDAADAFAERDPRGRALADGWHARLEPLRAFGTWPGLPRDLTADRTTDYHGPAVVITLGRLKARETGRFFKASAKAEAALLAADGVLWSTALARPPFVSTCSLWSSTRALSSYAYGNKDRGHPDAIDRDRERSFHHEEAFVRFRPTRAHGSLGGRNALDEAINATMLEMSDAATGASADG